MTRRLQFNTAATIVLLSLTAAALRVAEVRTPGSLAHDLNTIPQAILGWTSDSNLQLPENVTDTLKATQYLQRSYRRGRNNLELFAAYYSEQRAGESIHTPKHCLPGGGWEFAEMGTVAIPFRGSSVTVNNYIIQQGNERLRVLYWYHSRSRIVANEYAAKAYLAHDSIVRGSTDGAIVRIAVKDQPGALEDAVGFAAGVLPHVQKCFGDSPQSIASIR